MPFNDKYTDTNIINQIDFMLRQSGKGYGYAEYMIQALRGDRKRLYLKLLDIAEGDGFVDINEITDFIENYKFVEE